jgi:hypothetical protein
MGIRIVPTKKYMDSQTTDEKISKRKKEARELSKRLKRKNKIRKADATTADEGGGGGGTMAGGRKRSRGSMRKGLSAAKASAKKREPKVRVPTIKARPGPTKVKPTKEELEMDRQLGLQRKAPNIYNMLEKSNKMGGGKVKEYKKGGPITYRMSGGQVVNRCYSMKDKKLYD